MYDNIDKYKDIIDFPHHESRKHPRMSMSSRAAQFAPFAALTGFEDEIEETARLTSQRIELSEEKKEELNLKLQYLKMNIDKNIKVSIVYFVPDLKKEGGEYVSVTDCIKKIDEYTGTIKLDNGKVIVQSDITEIYSDEIKIDL